MELKLFNFNNSANFFKLSLCSLSIFLGNSFLDSLGSAVNSSLSFSKAETCKLTNNLNNLDLFSANFLKDNVELGLLFFSSCACVSYGTCYCNSCSGGYAKLFFYRM